MFHRFSLVVAFIVVFLTGLSYCYGHDIEEFPTEEATDKSAVDDMGHEMRPQSRDDSEVHEIHQVVADDDDDVAGVIEKCTPGKVLSLNTNNFNLMTQTGRFCILIFESPLSYVSALAKIKLGKLAKEMKYRDAVCISDLDCTKSKEICHELQIEARPTFLWYQNGRKLGSYNGKHEVESLRNFVDEMIASNGTFVEKSGAREISYLTINIVMIVMNLLAI
ncbi:thioredoxin domain-containing protein 5 homolog [Drosophila guanche]|uniref:thioredoxin domain-containing protein 5 homolog n=1 Tax=Drosophila guanche TaxID=7266 RepID=UPI00147168BD|nr:thioredoxin domain-containing protein 5 homolog [Drosophila guanche]